MKKTVKQIGTENMNRNHEDENITKLAAIIRKTVISWLVLQKETWITTDKILAEDNTRSEDRYKMLLQEAGNYQKNVRELLELRSRSLKYAVRELFGSVDRVNIYDVIMKIRDEENDDTSGQQVIDELKSYLRKSYLMESDDTERDRLSHEWAEIVVFVKSQIDNQVFMREMTSILLKATEYNMEEISGLSQLPFSNVLGQFIDENRDVLVMPNLFSTKRWRLDYLEELLFQGSD